MLNLKETTNKINIIIALALTAFIIISYIFTPYSKSFGVEVENPSRKMIALTFDDGPSDYTQALLDGLKSKNAKATFFVLGKKAQKNTETIKNIINHKSDGAVSKHSLIFRLCSFFAISVSYFFRW